MAAICSRNILQSIVSVRYMTNTLLKVPTFSGTIGGLIYRMGNAVKTDTFIPIGFTAALILNRLSIARELAENGIASGEIGAPRVLGVSKRAEINGPLIKRHRRDKLAASTCDVVSAPAVVSGVDGPSGLSQIGEAVIGSNAVDVVDLLDGPTPMNVQPSEPMSHEAHLIDRDIDVPSLGLVVCDGPGTIPVVDRDAPSEHARLGIVIQKFAKALCCETAVKSICHLTHQQRIESARRDDEERRQKQDDEEQAVSAELKRLNKRPALLRARVGE
jgi:hypothetical protein